MTLLLGLAAPALADTLTLVGPAGAAKESLRLPYHQAGLSDRQAALHLLNRFAYGPKPGSVDKLLAVGIERWVELQLEGTQSDPELNQKLERFESTHLSAEGIRRHFRDYGEIQRMALKQTGLKEPPNSDPVAQRAYTEALKEFREAHHLKLQNDLVDETRDQKLLRAVSAKNQLREVLTDFWFNHFNVNVNTDGVRANLLSYERDVLRPNGLGNFRDLLGAAAHHPAMLNYLNNAQSMSGVNVTTTLQTRLSALPKEEQSDARKGQPGPRRAGGLNENFGRELMELHTLGVDGGYDQHDVIEVARALTGWAVLYREVDNARLRQQIATGGPRLGYFQEGDFFFRPDWHDANPKRILGVYFPKGGDHEEGEKVLSLLARHPSTARFICRKLAERFVADDPPPGLVNAMAATFQARDGNIREVMRTLVQSREFWSERSAKLKSPLELLVSGVRAMGADYDPTRNQADWISRMGEPLYGCVPPTGYSEHSDNWMSPGTLVNRLNFAMQLASNRVQGVKVDPFRLVNHGLTPDRTSQKLLVAMLPETTPSTELLERLGLKLQEGGDGYAGTQRNWFQSRKPQDFDARKESALAYRALGVILGSPEFQRH